MRKYISFLLSFILISLSLNVTAIAYNDNDLTYYHDSISLYDDNGMKVQSNSIDAPLYNYPFDLGGPIYLAGNILSPTERKIYDALVALPLGELSVHLNFTPILTKVEFDSINWGNIINSFSIDKPDIFYSGGISWGWGQYPDGSVPFIDVEVTIEATKVNNQEIPNFSVTELSQKAEELQNKINSIPVDLTTRYDFVKSVHDYLCNNLVYDLNSPRCHDPYGALVEGRAVCQGYAESFKMICDIYGVPSVCLTGKGNGGDHMWNAVQMDDGLWYLLDVTWDDQRYGIYYDYFLAGLNTLSSAGFGGTAFNVSHEWQNQYLLPHIKISNTAYTLGNAPSEFGATYNSFTDSNRNWIVVSFFDIEKYYNNFIYYNGMKINADTYYTSNTFTANNEQWEMVLVGDCNGDGVANGEDYSISVNKALNNTKVTSSLDGASDVNLDGCIDVLDLSILERALNGKNTDIKIS